MVYDLPSRGVIPSIFFLICASEGRKLCGKNSLLFPHREAYSAHTPQRTQARSAHKRTAHTSAQRTHARSALTRTAHTRAQRTQAHDAHTRTAYTSARRRHAHSAHKRTAHTSAQRNNNEGTQFFHTAHTRTRNPEPKGLLTGNTHGSKRPPHGHVNPADTAMKTQPGYGRRTQQQRVNERAQRDQRAGATQTTSERNVKQ